MDWSGAQLLGLNDMKHENKSKKKKKEKKRWIYQSAAGAHRCQRTCVVDDWTGVKAELFRGQVAQRCALVPAPLLHHKVPWEKLSAPRQIQIEAPSEGWHWQNYVIRVNVSSPRGIQGAPCAVPLRVDSVVGGQVRLQPGQQPGNHFICLQLRLDCGEGQYLSKSGKK